DAGLDAVARGSRSSYCSAIAACLNWADRNGWPGLARLVPQRRHKSRPRNFAFDGLQWAAFWRAMQAARFAGCWRPTAHPRTIDAIAVGALSALRLGELVTLRWDEVSIPNRVLWLHETKVGDRAVAISPVCAALIERQPRVCRYVWGRPDGSRVSESGVSHAYRRIIQRHGEDGLAHPQNCFHSLRHSWASMALRRGVPMEIVRRQLGHSTVHMTNRYAHLGDPTLRAHVDDVEKQILGSFSVQLCLGIHMEV